MKKYKIILPLLFLGTLLCGQEVEVEFSFFDIGLSTEEIIAKSDKMKLSKGQWTDIDRAYKLPRFRSAMEFIVISNRTDLLGSLVEISAYYSYLDEHPAIANAGIKWQHEAAKVTLALQAVPIAMVIAYFTGKIYTEIANHDDDKARELKKMLDEGISPQGLDFMDGTASKRVCADVTKNYFSPIIQGKIKVSDPFKFDADLLYREQYEILQPNYYSKFNDFDNTMIVGWMANLYPMTTLDLKFPRNRLFIGLDEMGYSENEINGYISQIK